MGPETCSYAGYGNNGFQFSKAPMEYGVVGRNQLQVLALQIRGDCVHNIRIDYSAGPNTQPLFEGLRSPNIELRHKLQWTGIGH